MISKTPRFMVRLATVSLTALVLSGCVGTGEQITASAAEVDADTKIVDVAGQKVTLGRAANYCFNDRQSKIASSGAFVVLAPCDPEDEGSTAKGLILINVLAEQGIMDAIEARDLEAYFQSEPDRAALAVHTIQRAR